MSESRMAARVIRLDFHEGNTGLFYATSPDLKGLVLARPSLDELYRAIPGAIQEMYQACGERVVVSRVGPDDVVGPDAWVAFPSAAAQEALDAQAGKKELDPQAFS